MFTHSVVSAKIAFFPALCYHNFWGWQGKEFTKLSAPKSLFHSHFSRFDIELPRRRLGQPKFAITDFQGHPQVT
jgi:hypothetical protein